MASCGPLVLLALAALAVPAAASPAVTEPPLPAGRVWYVDNTAPPVGDGSLVAPFETLDRALRAADRGDTLYVFRGDGTARGLAGGVTLRPHQRLIGSGVAFAAEGVDLPAGAPPVIGGGGPAGVTLADHCTVAGIVVAGEAIGLQATGVRGIAVRDTQVETPPGAAAGVLLDAVADAEVTRLAVSGAASRGLAIATSSGVALRALSIDLATAAAPGAALHLLDPAGDIELIGGRLRGGGGPALAVEATSGEARVVLRAIELRAPPEGGESGLQVRVTGTAVLDLHLAGSELHDQQAVEARAGGGSRLRLRLAGNGFSGDPPAVTAVAAHAAGTAELEVTMVGNDLQARDAAVLLTGTDEARLRVLLDGNAVQRVGRGRGFALLLAEAAEGEVRLTRNDLAGHHAEAALLTAGDRSRLAVELRDNVVGAAAPGAAATPSLLLQVRDTAQLCFAGSGNQVPAGAGGAPALRLRQSGEASLALAGRAAPVGEAAGHLAARNRLAGLDLDLERPLADPAGLLCPAGADASPRP